MICSEACKTFIRRFDSDPRLHLNSYTNKALSISCQAFSDTCQSVPKTAKLWRKASRSLTAGLTRSLTAGGLA